MISDYQPEPLDQEINYDLLSVTDEEINDYFDVEVSEMEVSDKDVEENFDADVTELLDVDITDRLSF